jgi:Magnesium chelatase, subunit ChlI C-terminal/Magnesium chelatase, subunit ChlI
MVAAISIRERTEDGVGVPVGGAIIQHPPWVDEGWRGRGKLVILLVIAPALLRGCELMPQKKGNEPCLCSFHGSTLRQCTCSPLQRENYLGKISGPLLDRIAIHVAVRPVDIDAWNSPSSSSLTSAAMRELVVRARDIQAHRFAETNGVDCNARIPEGMFAKHCAMEPAAEALFVRAQKSLLVSARARGAHRSRRANNRGPR